MTSKNYDMLLGILYEISFCGTSSQQTEKKAESDRLVADVKSGKVECVDLDSMGMGLDEEIDLENL